MRKFKILFLIYIGCTIQIFSQDSVNIPSETLSEYQIEEDYSEDYDSYNETKNETPSKEDLGELYFEPKSFDPEFKEKYNNEKFNYNRKSPEKKIKTPPLFSIPTGFFKILMYIILGSIILIVLFIILKNLGGFSLGKSKQNIDFKSSANKTIEDEEDIQNNNFPQLIDQAKENKNFRLAIRYYYLWVLQKLAEKNYIQWNKDKTNFDYLIELDKKSIQTEFSQNIYAYDYIWYGKFPINLEEFELAESLFLRTLNILK